MEYYKEKFIFTNKNDKSIFNKSVYIIIINSVNEKIDIVESTAFIIGFNLGYTYRI